MFTVKTVSKYRNEAIYSAEAVSYFSGTDDTGAAEGGNKPCVNLTLEDNTGLSIYGGDVFVMNEGGKTVASYRFG